jgi:hypothetical protein
MFGHGSAAAAHQKVEIAAFIGLQHAVNIELLIAALGRCGCLGLFGLACYMALRNLRVTHLKV